jgi:2-phospho-L-lactate/phosphoenolpyruvate guanylyltransferase
VDWHVILPLKPPVVAKTRLRSATRSSGRHGDLVRAIQLDTLQAVLDVAPAAAICGIHLVGDDTIDVPIGDPRVELVADPGRGLNTAISATEAEIRRRWPNDAVVAMVADLPALRSADLVEVLRRAATVGRGFVADAAGTGTTMLTARPGRLLAPEFGDSSAARHRESGAVQLPAAAGASHDVDTAEDLRRCLQLGVGGHTARMVAYLTDTETETDTEGDARADGRLD